MRIELARLGVLIEQGFKLRMIIGGDVAVYQRVEKRDEFFLELRISVHTQSSNVAIFCVTQSNSCLRIRPSRL